MQARQFALASGAEIKWLMNSAALIRRRLTYSVPEARWWRLVRLLTATLGMPLGTAATFATGSLAASSNRLITIGADPSSSAALVIDRDRFESIFLGNLSRALVHETPRQRGRRTRAAKGSDALTRARRYGVDLGLIRSSLDRTPAERLALLESNARFVQELQRKTK
jgi:hypothetical protein